MLRLERWLGNIADFTLSYQPEEAERLMLERSRRSVSKLDFTTAKVAKRLKYFFVKL